MAAIAKLAIELGFRVTGSDLGVYPPMSDFLASQGIPILEGYSPEHLKPTPDAVIIGNAISRGNPEVEEILNVGLPYMSGPEFIGSHILPGRHAIVVAGTHGKTSTASLMAHLLESAGQAPGFMIGGLPENFGCGARLGNGEYFVLEGDEYDTAFFDKRSKFVHYHARTLILNNLEYDHADIFPDLSAIETQFHHLIRTLPSTGRIILNGDDDNLQRVMERGCWTPTTRFGSRGATAASWQWEALSNDGSRFRLWHEDKLFLEARWNMLGCHQVSNGCAAAAAAHAIGLSADIIQQGLESFSGIRRRMTLVGEVRGVKVLDDFAHHPTAISGVVTAARSTMGDNGRLWVVIEPRSNTMRGRIHEKQLPQCFRGANFVIFTPPSQRNLEPGAVLDVQAVCRAIGKHARVLADVDEIVRHIASQAVSGDYILILSNGSFDNIHSRLLQALST